MKPITFLIIIACGGLLVGCAASILPAELMDARQAYAHASASPATQLVPANLRKAREALAQAEKSFQDDPKSYRTRDLAILAYREAKEAETLGVIAADTAVTAQPNKDSQATKTGIAEER